MTEARLSRMLQGVEGPRAIDTGRDIILTVSLMRDYWSDEPVVAFGNTDLLCLLSLEEALAVADDLRATVERERARAFRLDQAVDQHPARSAAGAGMEVPPPAAAGGGETQMKGVSMKDSTSTAVSPMVAAATALRYEVARLEAAGLTVSSVTLSAEDADRAPSWTLHLHVGDPDGDQEEAVDLAALAGYHLVRDVDSDGAVLAYLTRGGDLWAPQTAIIRRRWATAEDAAGEGAAS